MQSIPSGYDPHPHKYKRMRRLFAKSRWSRRLATRLFGWTWKRAEKS